MSGAQYPTWHLLAGDYLAVMASSIASKQAFSSAGITISKRCNRLNGDIIKALQCLKSLNSQDLMSTVFPNVANEERFLDDADQQPANREGTVNEAVDDDENWTLEGIAEDAEDDDNLVDDVNVAL